jgi:hypothetical protein
MSDKTIPYADTVRDIACVLQEINAVGAKYGVFVYRMDKMAAEGCSGMVEVTLAFNPRVLHEYIELEVAHA